MPNKKIVVILLLCVAATALIVACGGSGYPAGTTTSPSTPVSTTVNTATSGSNVTVHMSYQTFSQPSVTIRKGGRITLVDDVAVPHDIANGTWDNNTARPLKETNAPSISVQLKGNDQEAIGPFSAAGTYHLYCTIHPGMNLAVIVQ